MSEEYFYYIVTLLDLTGYSYLHHDTMMMTTVEVVCIRRVKEQLLKTRKTIIFKHVSQSNYQF